jgi:hypothetical protein
MDLRGAVGGDTLTRPGMLIGDLVKRYRARRWALQLLGVKGSQVQILSARLNKRPA